MLAMFSALAGKDTLTQIKTVKYNKLTDFEEFVLIEKGTERPWTGEFV